MKRVVIIGAHFAPSSLPPAQRLRNLAAHLHEYGWDPIVLTVDPSYYEDRLDPDNEHLVPPSVQIIRTPALPVSLTRRFGVGDLGVRSLWHHWRALVKLCGTRQVDVVVISVPPYMPMVLGRLAHLRFGIPYLVDYQDPWISDYYYGVPRHLRPGGWKWRVANGLARALEPYFLRDVAHLVAVSRETVAGPVARNGHLIGDDVSEIPLGIDPFDFEYLAQHPRANTHFRREDGCLHLAYVGAYVSSMEPVLRAFFAALCTGLERWPDLFRRVRVHFVGTSYAPDGRSPANVSALAREMNVSGLVDEHSMRVPYLDALQLTLDAHGVLALGSTEPHYSPSKLFPLVLSRRPLLAILHDRSSGAELLQTMGAGRLVTFEQADQLASMSDVVAEHIRKLLISPQEGQDRTRWEVVERYTASSLAQRLAGVLDHSLATCSSGRQSGVFG